MVSLSSRCSGPGLNDRLCRVLLPEAGAGRISGNCAQAPKSSVSMLCSPCTVIPAGLLTISKSAVFNKIGISVGMRDCLPEAQYRLPYADVSASCEVFLQEISFRCRLL